MPTSQTTDQIIIGQIHELLRRGWTYDGKTNRWNCHKGLAEGYPYTFGEAVKLEHLEKG
jgi:hypothetical protein